MHLVKWTSNFSLHYLCARQLLYGYLFATFAIVSQLVFFDLTMIIPRRDIFRSSAARYMYNFFFLVCFAAVKYFRRILKRGERWKLFMQRREVVEGHLLERRNP